MQPAAVSPRWNRDQPASSAAVSTAVVHHVVTVDSSFLLSQPTLAPFANTTLLPPLLSALPASCFRVYSRFHVKSTLALMGVKPRHIHRIVAHTFQQLTQLLLQPAPESTALSSATFVVPLLAGETTFSYSSAVCLSSAAWLSLVRSSLTLSKHYTPSATPALFAICHSIVSRQQHVLILLAGTSGTGKSTLASLLADRMRLSCVIGTDSVRHILRQRVNANACRVLHVSTYQAHQCIADDADLSQLSAPYTQPPAGQPPTSAVGSSVSTSDSFISSAASSSASLSQAQKVKLGHHQQSLHVCAHLHSLIASLIASRISAIIEGAHLLPAFLSYLIATLSSSRTLVLPFLIYISNETKHRERFALRSHPSAVNPYILHFPAIRTIQKHMLASADAIDSQHWLPTIDNTNMDRSVAAAHEIVSRVMVREGTQADGGGCVQWSGEDRAAVLREVDEMRAGAWSSKAMQRIIRMKVEKRHLFDRLREAEWKRREEEDGGEEGKKDGDAKDAARPSFWSDAASRFTDIAGLSTGPVADSQSPSTTSPHIANTLPTPLQASSAPKQPSVPAQPATSQLTRSPVPPVHSPSSSPPPPSTAFLRNQSSVLPSSRPRVSPSSPVYSPPAKLSPHLSSLPPPFLHHHHQRSGRPSSSDDDEADSKRGGGGVSESERSVSVTYSHDVPSLLAPSADDEGDGDGDGGVDGSDDERGDEDDDGHERGIVAIPESDDAGEDGPDGPNANDGDSDSASDGSYEPAGTEGDDRQPAGISVVGKGGICSASGGVERAGSTDVLNGADTLSSSYSSGSGSRRREIVLY